MFLSRVEIDGVRGFESFVLDLHPRLTVLVGPNGCGKTTVLDAIVAGARGSVHVSGPRGAFVTGKERGEVRFVVTDEESGTTGSFVRPLSRHGGTDGVSRGWFATYQQKTLWLCFGPGRTVVDQTPGAVTPKGWKASDAATSWWEAALSFDSFFKWMREREDLENERVRDEKGLLPELLAVRAAVSAVVPEYTEIRVRRTVPGLSDTPLLMLKKHGKELPFDALSEGERMLIVLVADIARRMTMMARDPVRLDVPALILIDEIELHLHPKWQREILGRLLHVFPNAQFVVTTHSPIVVSEIERENLRVLNDFKLVTTEHGRGRDVNQVLEDTFGVSIRTREVEEKFREIKGLVDDENYDAALEALDELEKEIGDEPDVVYYRTLATRFRAASVHE